MGNLQNRSAVFCRSEEINREKMPCISLNAEHVQWTKISGIYWVQCSEINDVGESLNQQLALHSEMMWRHWKLNMEWHLKEMLTSLQFFWSKIELIFQNVGVGKLRPNILIMGFMSRWNNPEVKQDLVQEYFHVVQWVPVKSIYRTCYRQVEYFHVVQWVPDKSIYRTCHRQVEYFHVVQWVPVKEYVIDK
jgi:hypothetical protein